MVFKEVETIEWSYKNVGDYIEGVLISKKSNIGKNNANIYSIETLPGLFVDIWGTTILDNRMSLVKVGDKVRITYKGLGEKTDEEKNPVKIFKVEVDRD